VESQLTHPDFETLLDYINRRLDDTDHIALEQHLGVCAECQALLTHARALIDSLREQPAAIPSASLVQRAVAAFRQIQDRRSERPAATATLLFDSWDGAMSAGVRGHATERQLLFHCADLDGAALDVDVQITPDLQQQLYLIQGQTLREGIGPALLEGLAIKLIQADSSQFLRGTIIDRLGRFHFSQVPSGHYLLQIELHDTKVRVGALVLVSR